MSCKIQLAIDARNMNQALEIARQASPWVDILEAGTPLIKSVGIQIVEKLKSEHPKKLVLADLKSSDVGAYEAEMAFEAGADITTTLGVTTTATITEVQRVADQWGRRCLVDLTGVTDPVKRVHELIPYGVNLVLYHRSIDEEVTRGARWSDEVLSLIGKLCELGIDVSVAGGLDSEKLFQFSTYPLYALVVGRAITQHSDPAAAAETIAMRVKDFQPA